MSARPLAMNLLGIVEHPASSSSPYRIGRDGRPYVPVGDGGIVLGVELGDGVFSRDADHVAPGACLVHPDPAARLALVGLSCIGDEVVLRSGAAAGASGRVVGKRGEEGRVIVRFEPDVLAALRPGDQVAVRAEGQGASLPWASPLSLLNLRPDLLEPLGIEPSPSRERGDPVTCVQVRCELPSKLMGNGIGRPSQQWCLDLQLAADDAVTRGADGLALGDLVALRDVDARYNIGFRRGCCTVGVVVHGASPLPGHGPGVVAILSGPATALALESASPGRGGLRPGLLA